MDIPMELRRCWCGKRANVKTGGRLQWNRTRCKPCLPSVVTENVRLLANKLDEISTLVNSQQEFSERNLLCFTQLAVSFPMLSLLLLKFHQVRWW